MTSEHRPQGPIGWRFEYCRSHPMLKETFRDHEHLKITFSPDRAQSSYCVNFCRDPWKKFEFGRKMMQLERSLRLGYLFPQLSYLVTVFF